MSEGDGDRLIVKIGKGRFGVSLDLSQISLA